MAKTKNEKQCCSENKYDGVLLYRNGLGQMRMKREWNLLATMSLGNRINIGWQAGSSMCTRSDCMSFSVQSICFSCFLSSTVGELLALVTCIVCDAISAVRENLWMLLLTLETDVVLCKPAL